jgi:cobalt-zinc-cadmium efflux system outer membrane protein
VRCGYSLAFLSRVPMKLSLKIALAALPLVAGCVHYEARPPAPDRFAADYDARRLEPPPGGAWTDDALLSAAIARSPAVRQAALAYRSAVATARAARTPPPIGLTLVAEYSRDAGGTTPWLYSGLFDIPLNTGPRRATGLRSADLATVQALYDYAEAIWAVRTAIVHAHIDRLAADRQSAAAQAALALRQDRAAKLELRIRSGEDARPAGLTAQTDLVAAERKLRDVQALGAQADAALARALGLSEAAVQGLALSPLPDALPAPASADLAAWRQEAALRRRDILRAVADYDIAEQSLRLEVAKQYPDIHLGPGYTFERGQHKIPFDLTLVLPPRDLNRANIQAAEARRAQAGAKLDAAQALVLSTVDQAVATLAAAGAGLRLATDRDLPTARRAAEAARRSAAEGELDRTDQEAAEAAALDAEIAGLDAWRLAWAAAADLEDALRRPSPRESVVLEAAVKQAGDNP